MVSFKLLTCSDWQRKTTDMGGYLDRNRRREDLALASLQMLLRESAPRLAMRAAAQPAQINDHRDQQPQKIDSRRRHAAVQFPCVYERGERQENEAEYRQHQTTVECALQVRREDPHQHERDARKQQDDEQEEARHSQSQAGQHEPAQCDDTRYAPGSASLRIVQYKMSLEKRFVSNTA